MLYITGKNRITLVRLKFKQSIRNFDISADIGSKTENMDFLFSCKMPLFKLKIKKSIYLEHKFIEYVLDNEAHTYVLHRFSNPSNNPIRLLKHTDKHI